MCVGLDDEKSKKVCSHKEHADLDQLLELHTNLTSVQSKLLDILQSHWREGDVRDAQQREMRKHWTKFTVSLEETLDSISVNTSRLMTDLFSGFMRLQSFTKDSTRFLTSDLQSLQGDVQNVRGELRRMHDDIGGFTVEGIFQVEELAEMSRRRLSMVLLPACTLNVDTRCD